MSRRAPLPWDARVNQAIRYSGRGMVRSRVVPSVAPIWQRTVVRLPNPEATLTSFVTWACSLGAPLSADGITYLFDHSSSGWSPWTYPQTIYVDRDVASFTGTGTYTVTLEVRDGATVYTQPWLLAGWQTGTHTDFADFPEDQWYFDLSVDVIPDGTVLDDVRLTVTFSGSLAVVWAQLCVGYTAPG